MAAVDIMMATKPELAVYRALIKLGEPFEFQSAMMGGREVRGGAVADFLLNQYSLIISVIGWYWHTNRPETAARDSLQRIALASQGYTVIYIDEDHALQNATFYCQEAIRGVDHSRYRYLV